MKNKRILLTVFIFLLVIQLIVPAYMIFNRELVLSSGKQLKFRVEPVDPYHPFRGRYVSVNIRDTEVRVEEEDKYYNGQTVYGVLDVDEKGFASISGISRTVPEGKDYFKTKVMYVYENDGGNRVRIKPPFDRYYMEEKLAPKAESEYNARVRERNEDVYVTTKLLNGSVVLERLYIEGVTVEEFIKNRSN